MMAYKGLDAFSLLRGRAFGEGRAGWQIGGLLGNASPSQGLHKHGLLGTDFGLVPCMCWVSDMVSELGFCHSPSPDSIGGANLVHVGGSLLVLGDGPWIYPT